MTKSEFDSLISLLDDTDESVFVAVQNRLRDGGLDIVPYLEKVWQTSDNSRVVRILEHLIHDIRIDAIIDDLLKWKMNGAKDLLVGVAIYNRLLFPNVEADTLRTKIASICKPIWTELNSNLTALEKVRIINHFLFDVNRFMAVDDMTTQSHFLGTLLNTGKAQTNILSVLYAIVAQQLGLAIRCVAHPNALTLCYLDEYKSGEFQNDVMFYIDARSRGVAYGASEITDYLNANNIDSDESFFKPCSNLDVVIYLISSLAQCFKRLKDTRLNDCEQIIDSLIQN